MRGGDKEKKGIASLLCWLCEVVPLGPALERRIMTSFLNPLAVLLWEHLDNTVNTGLI